MYTKVEELNEQIIDEPGFSLRWKLQITMNETIEWILWCWIRVRDISMNSYLAQFNTDI